MRAAYNCHRPGGHEGVIAACRIDEAEQERRPSVPICVIADAIPGHGDARRRSSSAVEIELGYEARLEPVPTVKLLLVMVPETRPLTAAVAFASSVTGRRPNPTRGERVIGRWHEASVGLSVGRALDEWRRDVELCGRSSFCWRRPLSRMVVRDFSGVHDISCTFNREGKVGDPVGAPGVSALRWAKRMDRPQLGAPRLFTPVLTPDRVRLPERC